MATPPANDAARSRGGPGTSVEADEWVGRTEAEVRASFRRFEDEGHSKVNDDGAPEAGRHTDG